jgi:hypothetical protein
MNRPCIWIGIVVACCSGSIADCVASAVNYNDGQQHVIASQVLGDFVISNGTTVAVQGDGWIRSTASGINGSGTVVLDSSRLSILSGTVSRASSGPGNATGVELRESARLALSGGELVGVTSGPGNAVGVLAGGTSSVVVTGGTVRASTSSPGVATGVVLDDESFLELKGGLLRVTTSEVQAYGVVVNDMARARISGGDIGAFSSAFAATYDLILNDSARVEIAGRSSAYPPGIPLAAVTGQVSGTYMDGSSFSFSFQRGAAATILLVPEPGTAALVSVGLLLFLVLGRRPLRSPAHF